MIFEITNETRLAHITDIMDTIVKMTDTVNTDIIFGTEINKELDNNEVIYHLIITGLASKIQQDSKNIEKLNTALSEMVCSYEHLEQENKDLKEKLNEKN